MSVVVAHVRWRRKPGSGRRLGFSSSRTQDDVQALSPDRWVAAPAADDGSHPMELLGAVMRTYEPHAT
jgi:hypothetical protein